MKTTHYPITSRMPVVFGEKGFGCNALPASNDSNIMSGEGGPMRHSGPNANQGGSKYEDVRRGKSVYIYDNDGHFGDFISLALLHTHVGDDLIGVSLNEGDCLTEIAAKSYAKLINMLGSKSTLSVSNVVPPNEFPLDWQKMSHEFDAIIDTVYQGDASVRREAFGDMVDRAVGRISSNERIVLIGTGPLTTVADFIGSGHPHVSRISEIVLMGGAISVAGNVEVSEISDGSAEWNFFANPEAAKIVLTSGIPVTLVPLDVTNAVPITPEFISQTSVLTSNVGRLTHSLLTYAHSKYPTDYYLWDPLAIFATLFPGTVDVTSMPLDVATSGVSQGRIFVSDAGNPCNVVTKINREAMLELFFSTLKV